MVFEALVRFAPSTVRLALVPVTADVYASAVLESWMLEFIVSVPALPAVCDVSERLEVPSLLVIIAAFTPRVAELVLMKDSRPERVFDDVPVARAPAGAPASLELPR